jgi:hypothetical protein
MVLKIPSLSLPRVIQLIKIHLHHLITREGVAKMLNQCFEPASVVACLKCLENNHECRKLYDIRDALWLKSMDECLECDSNCKKCIDYNLCLDLQEKLYKKIPKR